MRVDISALGKRFRPITRVGLGCVDRPAIFRTEDSFVIAKNELEPMDFLEGKLLMNIDEPVTAEDRIRDGVLVLYYFVSMDCDRCRTFDDELAKVYSRAMRKEKDILVVVVPTDDSGDNIEVMNSYPQWYMIPFEDELRVILRYNFGVTHVPQLIVVRKDGELVTRCGRAEVEEIGINVLITWSE